MWRSCSTSLVDSAADAIRGATPVVIEGLVPPPTGWLFQALAGNETIRVDVSPLPMSPVKLRDNATLIKPAEIMLPLQEALVLLRQRGRGYHVYVRHLELRTPKTAELWSRLPLDALRTLIGPRVEAANLWLGDGGMSSSLHYDGFDNLLVQLAGEKHIRLLPPELHPRLRYRSYVEHRFVFDAPSGQFFGHTPASAATGEGSVVENHSDLNVMAERSVGKEGAEREGAAEAAEAAEVAALASEGGLACTLRPGEALFLPALWSHAVTSEPDTGAEAGAAGAGDVSAARGLNVAINLWFMRGRESFDHALQLLPSWAEGHFCLAEVLAKESHAIEARAAYRRAVVLRPTYFDGYHNLASSLLEDGALEEAALGYIAAIQLRPSDARCLVNLGVTRRKQARIEEAASSYTAALALVPSERRALGAMGNVRALQGRLLEAQLSFASVLRMAPADARAYNSLGVVMEEDDRPREAIAAFQAAVRLDPDWTKPQANLEGALRAAAEKSGVFAGSRAAPEQRDGLASKLPQSRIGGVSGNSAR
uniref:JmjC domain-containing protein n=1 Tax=Haptolina ericina TaxID=156174 RepID=A0A7S3BRB2_9EUKA|mmetsp:Transcript_65582/g.146330  ORF Transcript_65582/g.146330 Transcript_65582/m.146330 type:complete len:538 (+) Transcript_65582:20-1633(+)